MSALIRDNWFIWLITAVGLAGVYFLLPRPRGSRPILGAGLGILAAVLAAISLIRREAPLPESILFYGFSGLAILGGGLMLAQRNPVHAALSFAVVVLSSCGLFLLLAAPFLMAATIIVYAGAIIVTFLFVIMLAQQEGMNSADQRSREPFLTSLGGFIFLAALLCVLYRSYDTRELDQVLVQIRQVAEAKTESEVKRVLGDPAEMPVGSKTPPFLAKIHKVSGRFPKEKLDEAALAWSQKPDLQKTRSVFQELYEIGRRARSEYGSLPRPDKMELSPFSDSQTANHQLPARNVTALGRSLFTDYLLPVELAGTLLLVASIGAIVIAGRRTEGLR